MAGPLINKTVRLSKEQIAALKEEAALDRREFSDMVRIAVDDLIEDRRLEREPMPANGAEAVTS